MLSTYVTGLVAVVVMSVVWVAVQGAWGRVFATGASDPDVLAGRLGCSGTSSEGTKTGTGCSCTQSCDRRRSGGACSDTEGVT